MSLGSRFSAILMIAYYKCQIFDINNINRTSSVNCTRSFALYIECRDETICIHRLAASLIAILAIPIRQR